MSLTSYRAAPPRVNRAPYLINGLADGKEMLGGRTEGLCASLVAPRGGGRHALTPRRKGDTPGESEPCESANGTNGRRRRRETGREGERSGIPHSAIVRRTQHLHIRPHRAGAGKERLRAA